MLSISLKILYCSSLSDCYRSSHGFGLEIILLEEASLEMLWDRTGFGPTFTCPGCCIATCVDTSRGTCSGMQKCIFLRCLPLSVTSGGACVFCWSQPLILTNIFPPETLGIWPRRGVEWLSQTGKDLWCSPPLLQPSDPRYCPPCIRPAPLSCSIHVSAGLFLLLCWRRRKILTYPSCVSFY